MTPVEVGSADERYAVRIPDFSEKQVAESADFRGVGTSALRRFPERRRKSDGADDV